VRDAWPSVVRENLGRFARFRLAAWLKAVGRQAHDAEDKEFKLKPPGPLAIALLAATILVPGCSPPESPDRPATSALPLANVTCNELSFYLNPALGSSYECEVVPESSNSDVPMDVFVYPAHTELAIKDYPLTHTQFPPRLLVYPVDRFQELLPDALQRRTSDLETLISGGALSSREMPFLPPLPMQQTFFSHVRLMSFKGGQGVRFITDYNESPHPISNSTILYTFQGLTDDRMYWVAVTLPISSPILPADADFDSLPGGYSSESWFQDYGSYVSGVKDALEAQGPGSFFPAIRILDGLVESITLE